MCGIIGYIGNKQVIPVLIHGLKTLEYRGYDSAGISYKTNTKIKTIKEKGKVEELEKILVEENSTLGIGHTRWATHGAPKKDNSHPHTVGRITLVHNGIIENYIDLKNDIRIKNHQYLSETDSEVACAMINAMYDESNDMLEVLSKVPAILKGSYALAIMISDIDDKLFVIRNDSPLLIGIGDGEFYVSSEMPAILKYTKEYYLLENHDYGVLTNNGVDIYHEGRVLEKEKHKFDFDLEAVDKNGFEHFMLKEINEQPNVVKNLITEYLNEGTSTLLEKLPDISKYERVDIIACGSAYHAGLVGKSLIEKYGEIPVNVEVASEYRYKNNFLNDKVLAIFISQSGETADTIAALRKVKEEGVTTLGIVNVFGSAIAREADMVLYTNAGIEVSVATTKGYLAQITVLSLIAFRLGLGNKKIVNEEEVIINYNLLVDEIKTLISNTDELEKIAKSIYKNDDIFFLGRQLDYSLVMEGSLKLKEISYLHSEAYQAGELKHGSIALISEGTPVISVITDASIAEKTISNVKETKARGSISIIITTLDIDNDASDVTVQLAKLHPLINGALSIVAMQLISYYVAKLNGCDIDKPKNLAKSVTVE